MPSKELLQAASLFPISGVVTQAGPLFQNSLLVVLKNIPIAVFWDPGSTEIAKMCLLMLAAGSVGGISTLLCRG